MMHEITVCIVEVAMLRWFGLKTYHGYNGWHGLREWEWSTTSTGLGTDGKVVPVRAVLALLFGAAVKRVGCGPTWVVPTWSCGAGRS